MENKPARVDQKTESLEPVSYTHLAVYKRQEPVFANYKNKSLSVQSCADIMNPFGTSYDNGTDYPCLLYTSRCV